MQSRRAAAVADALTRLLAWSGVAVERETSARLGSDARAGAGTLLLVGEWPPDAAPGAERVAVQGGRWAEANVRGTPADVDPAVLDYLLLRQRADRPVTLSLAAARRPAPVNPAFAVQLGHARLVALAAGEANTAGPRGAGGAEAAAVADLVDRFPEVAGTAAAAREPYRVARWLEALAGAAETWYYAAPAAGLPPAERSLAAAARDAAAVALTLMGLAAPERI